MKFILITFFLLSQIVHANEIAVYYYERPPFYYTDESGKAAGILVDKVRQLGSAPFKIDFKLFPPKRQLIAIQTNDKNVCGLGWFKTEDRQKIGVFSAPIFTDSPLGIMIHKNFGFKEKISVETIFKNPKFELLKKNSFKYSDAIEESEQKLKPKTYIVSSSISSMVDMISKREKYYTFMDEVEAQHLFSTKPELKEMLLFIPIIEAKQGNRRYLFCSKNIPPAFYQLIKSFSF